MEEKKKSLYERQVIAMEKQAAALEQIAKCVRFVSRSGDYYFNC